MKTLSEIRRYSKPHDEHTHKYVKKTTNSDSKGGFKGEACSVCGKTRKVYVDGTISYTGQQ